MKSLARWSCVFVIALSISSFGIQPQVEEASALANDSQDNFNQDNQIVNHFLPENGEILETIQNNLESIEDLDQTQTITTTNLTNTSDDKDKKLVKKTVMVGKSAVRMFRATAYCLKGRTATGGAVRRGIVAADTRLLPLGTKIYINGGGYSGTYTVTDTGGAVRGNILDIWVPSCSEAMRFGRRTVTVSIVN